MRSRVGLLAITMRLTPSATKGGGFANPHGMTITREERIKKILYRTWYRGCKETDRVLGGFAKAHAEGMTDAELGLMEGIMEEDDADLFRWLTGQEPLPERYNGNKVMAALMNYKCFEQQGG